MRRTAVAAALAALAVAVPGVADARGVTPAPKKIAGAFSSVSSCGALSGIALSWTSTANVVTAISLTSIPSACTGATLSLTLVGSGSSSLGTAGPVSITGTSQTISTISGSPTATSVTGAYVSVVGP